jgi:hypothetical protein
MNNEYDGIEDLKIDVNYDEIEENDMLIKNENDLIMMEMKEKNALKMFDVYMELLNDKKIFPILLLLLFLISMMYVNVSNETNEMLLLDKKELNEIVQINQKIYLKI